MNKKLVAAISIISAQLIYAGGDIAPVEPVVDTPAAIGETSYNVALKAGTLGLGLDISHMYTENFGLRLNINGLQYNDNRDVSGINYDTDLKLFTAGLLADYYPLENNFRVSAGVYYNDNHADGTYTPNGTFSFGNHTYTASDIGQVDAGVYYDNEIAPYIGIGWGDRTNSKGWHFTVDAGAMYQGSTQVYANATVKNPLLEDQIKQDIEVERLQIEDDIKDYTWYPVFMIGFIYNF